MALGKPTWLNLCFVEKILRKSKDDNSIQVIDIFSKPATNKGDNYASDMTRITIEYTRDHEDRKITEKKSLIVKILPMSEDIRSNLIQQSGLFDTEINMMTDALKKMNKLLGPNYPLNGECIYVQKDKSTFLMLEDLIPLGFCMADRLAGLDMNHCLLAIRGLARFHAASVALCEKEPNQKQTYKKGIYDIQNPPEMENFFIMGTKSLANEAKNWPELEDKHSEKINKLADHIYKIATEVSKYCENDFNVINHGDFWVNNMLFKYDDNGKPIQHIFVDFQLCVYRSPVLDLHYFFNTSPSPEIFENSQDFLLNEYHNTLLKTMKQLNCKTQPLTMEHLKDRMGKKAKLGMLAAFTVLPIMLSSKSEAKDLNEMLKDGLIDNPGYKSDLYRKIITKRILTYDKLGYLDI